MDNDLDNSEELVDEGDAAGSVETSPSPGSVLQAERERRGLSEKQIADQMHITMHYVRSLEADRYDKLPGNIFARGYIKSYALLMELPVDELLSRYDSFMEEKDEARQEVNRRIAARRQHNRNLPWLVFSIVAFLLGFISLWAYSHFFAAAEETRFLQETARDSLPPVDGSATALGEATFIPVAVDPETRIIALGDSGSDVLRVQFSGESWIEVSSGGATALYRDIQEAGDILQITGEAPFDVLLGDAPYASVQLNGVEIDVSNNIRIDNSARLTVGL